MKQRLIFHSPVAIDREPRTGSTLRPQAIYKAFLDEGIEVWLIDGDSKRRQRLWREAMQALNSGVPFLGVYSELSTKPMALCDPDYIPRRPFLDTRMFRRLRDSGIPVTAFYRDIHWKFPQFEDQLSLPIRIAVRPFFQFELSQILRSVSHLFLPSLSMKNALFSQTEDISISALPPGGLNTCVKNAVSSELPLRLTYVGGLRPPVHDISSTVNAVSARKNVRLTICCRKHEWMQYNDQYCISDNISIIHLFGYQLNDLLKKTDLFIMHWQMCDYLKFAMPVKMFQAIGAGLPVITNANTEMGDLVQREDLGWAVETEDELKQLLQELVNNPKLIVEKKANVLAKRETHSWNARARQVIETLQALQQKTEQVGL